MIDTVRYWDGARWTDNVAPSKSAPRVALKDQDERDISSLVTAGYVCAVLVSVVGFIIGIVLLTKPKGVGHGIGVMIVSLVTFYILAQLISIGYF